LNRKIRKWLIPNSVFVVIRDQDGGDCREIKAKLTSLVEAAKRGDRTLIRIACRDLESWVLGDWQAIAEAFQLPNVADHGRKAKYRNPDSLSKPITEIKKFVPAYPKGDGARRIGPLLDPARNRSPSFRAFCSGVQRMLAT
jgi:hypothetical protein